MTSLLFVVLGAVVVALVVVVVRSNGRSSPLDPSPHGSSPWFERAGQVLDHADQLATAPVLVPGGQLGTLDDDQLRSVSRQFVDFSAEVAALSATAPTSMDARVARGLGVQSRLMGDLFDQELRRREVIIDDPDLLGTRPDPDQIEHRLREFKLATRDLRTHVELL